MRHVLIRTAAMASLILAGTPLAMAQVGQGGQPAQAVPVVQGSGALGQATGRNGAMTGGNLSAPQATPNRAAPNTYNQRRRVYPSDGPDTVPGYPRGTRRLGYDNDNDFSGANGVRRAPPNTNPDRRQLENAFDD